MTKTPLNHNGSEVFFRLWVYSSISIVIPDLKSGEVVFKNRNLRDQAFDQRFVKLRDGGGLLPDEILKLSDQPHRACVHSICHFIKLKR